MSITTYTDKAGNTRHRVEVTVGYTLEGRRDRRTKVCATLKEAKAAERGFEILKQGLGGRSDRITFREFTERYYLPMKREALRKTTMRGYESVIKNHLMPTFADTPLQDIGRLAIQSLLSSRSSHKVAKNTRDMLRQILGEAVLMEVVKTNPAAGRFKLPDKKETDRNNKGEWVTSLAEQRRIIALADDVLRPVLVLGFCLGLRKGEILGLDWRDVDMDARQVTVRQSYTHTKGEPDMDVPKTEGSLRTVPMSGYTYQQLKLIKGGVERVGCVCACNGRRLSPHGAQKKMQRFTRSHDVPAVTCLSLRHSFATAAIRSGVPVELVSKMLGHTNITTTYNRYVKPLQADLADAVAILDDAFMRAI
jgi:integrase